MELTAEQTTLLGTNEVRSIQARDRFDKGVSAFNARGQSPDQRIRTVSEQVGEIMRLEDSFAGRGRVGDRLSFALAAAPFRAQVLDIVETISEDFGLSYLEIATAAGKANEIAAAFSERYKEFEKQCTCEGCTERRATMARRDAQRASASA